MRGYIIDDGTCQYANEDQKVSCIIGAPVFHLNLQFMQQFGEMSFGWERRKCYVDAEEKKPSLGWMLKATNINPNDYIDFFMKWGIKITWKKASWC